jgi:outer membrane immunogenic protein
MKRILLAGAAFAALTSASYAADLSAPIEEVNVWSGYFIGIQGGYAWGDVSVDDVVGDVELYSGDIEGGFGGGYWGRNWQSGNWVYGLEGSISVASLEEDVSLELPFSPSTTIELFSTTRLKLGYAFDNFLVYAAGGLSIAKANVDDGFDSDDAYLKGFTVGAGIEAKFAESWSARVEYLYINYETEQRTLFDSVVVTPYDISVEDVSLVRGGIAYHF